MRESLRVKRVLVSIAALSLLVALVATPASAHTKRYGTTTTFVKTMQPDTGGPLMAVYSGTVSSSKQSCVANRSVSVTVPDGTLSTVTSDSAGNWSTPPISAAGDGVSVAKKFLKKNSDHKHYCKLFFYYP